MIDALIIFVGAFLGGFVSGLAGFGTALTALGIWLHVASPKLAAALILCCSVTAQAQTLPSIWHAIDWRRIWPMLAAGVLGIPIGTWLLAHADPKLFRLGIGLILLTFSSVMLAIRARPTMRWGGRPADAAVGFVGGVLGGLAGLSGSLVTVWATLRGWGKEEKRAIFQAYNTTMLTVAFVVFVASGFVTAEVGKLYLLALPGTLSGAFLGVRVYRRVSDNRFHDLVLVVLAFAGASLVWPFVFA
ncbi:MAG: sulfite exporter TauE/SafE family protein [Hyphomicrobiales bacterium]|nr:sulfite exporter TauE/SafE family protein [Hyphomicrobiales bacterium]